jgi:hypothetical protein
MYIGNVKVSDKSSNYARCIESEFFAQVSMLTGHSDIKKNLGEISPT